MAAPHDADVEGQQQQNASTRPGAAAMTSQLSPGFRRPVDSSVPVRSPTERGAARFVNAPYMYSVGAGALAPLPESGGPQEPTEQAPRVAATRSMVSPSSFGSRRFSQLFGSSRGLPPPVQPSPFSRLQPNPSGKGQGLLEEGRRGRAFVSMSKINKYMEATGARPPAEGSALEAEEVTRTLPDPQETMSLPGVAWIRLFVALNIAISAYYLYWRVSSGTITGIKNGFFDINVEDDYYSDGGTADAPQWVLGDSAPIWVVVYAWAFFGAEVCLVLAMWIGHSQRLFAVQRSVVTMDELCKADDSVGYNSRVSIFLPTAGERMDIVLKALLGALSQRGWDAGTSKRSYMRLVVLDEKRRKGVLALSAVTYKLAQTLQSADVRKILQFEGVMAPTPLSAYEWWKSGGGYARKHLYSDPLLNQVCTMIEIMEEIAYREDSGRGAFVLQKRPKSASSGPLGNNPNMEETTAAVLRSLHVEDVDIEPGFSRTFEGCADVPTLIYYSRKNPGTPKVSPKAGNMNAAIFAVDHPDMPPIIGDSTIVVVNDCRHQLQPNFLQRTVPYFFEYHQDSGSYCWAKIAYVQTPQRFARQREVHDPLGNHATMQYDVINIGKDGIGAVGSSGHGSLWRVSALRGMDAEGKVYADPGLTELVGSKLGFRSQMLIEDTHTSIEMFRAGWRSVYINEPGEHLSVCTHQPDNIGWRIKQVLRWHQGAVQLLLLKGPWYTSFGGQFPTIFHRIYAFDQATYYLQAIPGYMLLLMPIIYGVAGQSPFTAEVFPFFVRFIPFIVSALLPTAILGNRRGVNADRLFRDEQVWLSTTYVQLYAFLTMLWQIVTRRSGADAWAVKAPTWPLFVAFYGEMVALIGGLCWLIYFNYQSARIAALSNSSSPIYEEDTPLKNYPSIDWTLNFYSVAVSAIVALNALWPMVSMQMGWGAPNLYNQKVGAYVVGGGVIILISGVAYFQAISLGTSQTSIGAT